MKALRLSTATLLVAEVLILAGAILWPVFRHPEYLRDAHLQRSGHPTDHNDSIVQAAWDRKRREDRAFIIVSLCLMGVLAVPLTVAFNKAGSVYSALWRVHQQPPPGA